MFRKLMEAAGRRPAMCAAAGTLVLLGMLGGAGAAAFAQGTTPGRQPSLSQWLEDSALSDAPGAYLVAVQVTANTATNTAAAMPAASKVVESAVPGKKKSSTTAAGRKVLSAPTERGDLTVGDMATRLRAILAGTSEQGAAAGKVDYANGLAEGVSVIAPTANVNQARALAKLRANVADPADMVIYHSDKGTPSHIEAADLSDTTKRSPLHQSMARGFLNKNRELLLLQNPDDEMAVKSETVDSLGITRVRFRQMYLGIPVHAQEASVYISPESRVTRMSGRFRPTPELATVIPTLTLEQAQAEALRHAGEDLVFRIGELVILPDDNSNQMALAWHVTGYAGETRGWHFFFDATSGTLLQRYSAVHEAAVQGSGRDLSGNTVNFTAWQAGSKYHMQDVTRPGGAAGGALNTQIGNIVIYDKNNCTASACGPASSGALTSGWDPAAVSAMLAMYAVTDYYLNTFTRKSIDDLNGTIRSVVNVPGGSASWSPDTRTMFFSVEDTNFRNKATKDIAGHEMTHGITSATANLTYRGQSGALNESFSDFFAMMVKNSGWLFEFGIPKAYPYLRNMVDPHLGMPACSSKSGFIFAQPKHMDEFVVPDRPVGADQGGVHCNSGIPNRAFYLIAEGLTAERLGTSIGRVHAEQILYYALTELLGESSAFLDARRQLIVAARHLYPSSPADATAIARAFDLVGIVEPQVGGGSTTTAVPTDGDPINASSKLVYRRAADGGLMIESAGSVQGPLNANPASSQRPAVYWRQSDNKGVIFYVNEQTHSLRAVTVGTGQDALVASGDFYAFAVAPNGKYAAYTVHSNRLLYILDLVTGNTVSYTVLMPSPDGVPQDAGLNAYSPTFDYLSENIIFDFSVPHAQLDGSTIDQFSFGTLNLLTGYFDTLAAGQPASVQLLDPVYATNNNYIVAFDLVDGVTAANSGVYVRNIVTKGTKAITGLDLTGQQRIALGHPTFSRDDTAMYIQTRNTVNGTEYNPYLIVSSAIAKGSDGSWTPSAQIQPASSAPAGFPQVLIEGARSSVVNPAFTLSAAAIQFPSVAIGSSNQQSVVLTNTGNVDVTIIGISVAGSDFRTAASDRLLARGKALSVQVTFAPTAAGIRTGTLTITSDAGTKTAALGGTGIGSPFAAASVVEYYHSVLDNYFITADPVEQAAVDGGAAGAEWRRTGSVFKAGGSSQVCRFYGNNNPNPATGTRYGPNSHFYTVDAAECNGLKAAYDANAKSWFFESNDFNTTPAGAGGTCPAGLVPVYRAYNNGFARGADSNHRISTSQAAIAEVVGRGWRSEGVVMCAPS